MAQSTELPTPGLGLCHDPRVLISSPALGSVLGKAFASPLPFPLPLTPLMHTRGISLSLSHYGITN